MTIRIGLAPRQSTLQRRSCRLQSPSSHSHSRDLTGPGSHARSHDGNYSDDSPPCAHSRTCDGIQSLSCILSHPRNFCPAYSASPIPSTVYAPLLVVDDFARNEMFHGSYAASPRAHCEPDGSPPGYDGCRTTHDSGAHRHRTSVLLVVLVRRSRGA